MEIDSYLHPEHPTLLNSELASAVGTILYLQNFDRPLNEYFPIFLKDLFDSQTRTFPEYNPTVARLAHGFYFRPLDWPVGAPDWTRDPQTKRSNSSPRFEACQRTIRRLFHRINVINGPAPEGYPTSFRHGQEPFRLRAIRNWRNQGLPNVVIDQELDNLDEVISNTQGLIFERLLKVHRIGPPTITTVAP